MSCDKMLTNKGYIGIAMQSAKGVVASTSDYFIRYSEESSQTEFETTPLREGGDDEDIGEVVKNLHTEKVAFSAFARPELMNYIYAYMLGQESVTGAVDPFTHVITRLSCGRVWWTIRRKLESGVVQVFQDFKPEKISIEAEAGKEVVVNVEGQALTVNDFTSVEETPVYEASKVFTFYHGKDRYKINSIVTNNIKKFAIGYTITSQEGLQTDDILIADLPDLKVDVDVSLDIYADDVDDFLKTVNYNSEDTPQEDLYSFPFELDLRYEENAADDRGLKIEVGKIIAEPVSGINLKGEPEAMMQTLAGIAIVPDSGELFQVTCKNDISTNLITGS